CADRSTSIPPPEPRSSTVSPSRSSVRAVGLPQPSEAITAFPGRALVWVVSYRLEVIGSQPPAPGAAPQHELVPPASTRRAASPYRSRTVSLMVSASDIVAPPVCD